MKNMDFRTEMEVRNKMLWMGFRDNLVGTAMARQAVKLWEPGCNITKDLYPAIAKQFGTTPQCVERNIRHAIESAWFRGDEQTIESVFGGSIRRDKGKPTNSEFIARMAVYFGFEV